jgi:hypothetical protein
VVVVGSIFQVFQFPLSVTLVAACLKYLADLTVEGGNKMVPFKDVHFSTITCFSAWDINHPLGSTVN